MPRWLASVLPKRYRGVCPISTTRTAHLTCPWHPSRRAGGNAGWALFSWPPSSRYSDSEPGTSSIACHLAAVARPGFSCGRSLLGNSTTRTDDYGADVDCGLVSARPESGADAASGGCGVTAQRAIARMGGCGMNVAGFTPEALCSKVGQTKLLFLASRESVGRERLKSLAAARTRSRSAVRRAWRPRAGT